LRLRLVPGGPYVKAGPELHVAVPVAHPSIVRQILLAVVVLGVAAWVIAGWRRAPKAIVAASSEPAHAPPSGRAGVEVLAQPRGMTGWRGTVCDAHDGAPIAGARLRIVTPAFQGDGVAAEATADAQGAFTLESSASRDGARLVVESTLHSAYEQALPPPSVLGIALVTRRRALLERLVRWARRHGAPFDALPEPTPGHVRRAAARSDATGVATWAARVEAAAYGADSVGPEVEKEVRANEPHQPPG
ncbi:MAG TPA: carboxypeptidase-like regulatory domain-containing protein, partial [Byssovorax sp.]